MPGGRSRRRVSSACPASAPSPCLVLSPGTARSVLQRLRLAGGGRARRRALEPEAEGSAAWRAVGDRSVEQAALRMPQAEHVAEAEAVERAEGAVAHAMARLQRGVVVGGDERDEP